MATSLAVPTLNAFGSLNAVAGTGMAAGCGGAGEGDVATAATGAPGTGTAPG